MAFLRLLFGGNLIFIILTVVNSEVTQNKSRRPAYDCSPHVIPTSYEFELTPLCNEYIYTIQNLQDSFLIEKVRKRSLLRVNSIVTFNITRTTKQIKWHSREVLLQIQNTSFWSIGEKGEKKAFHCDNSYFESIVTYICREELKPGSYIMNIELIGNININVEGLFSTSVIEARIINDETACKMMWTAVSEMQKFGNLLTFPCWIESGLKAKFTIYAKNDEIYTAMSNIKIQLNRTITKEVFTKDMKKTQFFIDPATSTEFFVFCNIAYLKHYNMNTKIISTTRLAGNAIFVLKTYYNIITYLEKEWHMNSSEVQLRRHLVVLPNFREGNIKLHTLELYGEEDLKFDMKSKDNTRKIQITRLITRKIIDRWFNDKNKNESWSIEGLATFLEALVIDKVLPYSRMLDLFVVQLQHESMRLDCNSFTKLLTVNNRSDIDSLFFSPRYIRVPFMMRMLQHLITEDVFRKGVHQYVNAFALNSSATSHNFWSAMQSAIDKSDYTHNFNLTQFINGWMNESCLQRSAFYSYISNSMVVDFENLHSWDEHNRWIFLTHILQVNSNFSKTSYSNIEDLINISPIFSIWKFRKLFLRNFDKHGWIIINLKQIGYYRINDTFGNWQTIANYLNPTEFQKINVLNRAQIVDDVFNLVVERKLDISVFWIIASYLSEEIDYIAWYPMIRALKYMSSFFPFLDKRTELIKENLCKILNGFFDMVEKKTIWIDDSFNNIKHLINEVAIWSCTLGCNKFVAKANFNLQLHLKNLRNEIDLPQGKAWTYCNGLIKANNITWKKVVDVWLKTNDNQILEFLACSQNLDIIIDYIQLIISNKTIIRDNDIICSFHSIIERHARDSKVLTYVLSHFWTVKPRQVSTAAALIDIITHVYSQKHLDEVMQYIGYIQEHEMFLKLKSKIAMRLREIQEQTDYLQKLSKYEKNHA